MKPNIMNITYGGTHFWDYTVTYTSSGYVNLTSLAAITGNCPVRFLARKRIVKLIEELYGDYPSGTTLMVEVVRDGRSTPEIWVHLSIAAEFTARCGFPMLHVRFMREIFCPLGANPDFLFRSQSTSK